MRDDLLGVAAAVEQPHDPLATTDGGADELSARDQRQLLLGEVGVLDLVGVGEVNSCGLHLVELLTGPREGVGQVDEV